MKVKELEIKVTYRVGLSDLDIPEIVKQQLEEVCDGFKCIEMGAITTSPEAYEWLIANIAEKDCFELKYEVESID